MKVDYEIVNPSDLPKIDGRIVVADTETNGVNVMVSKPFMLQLGIDDKVYILRWNSRLVEWINNELPKAGLIVGHNIKFDLHMFVQGGCDQNTMYGYNVYDTMVAESLINENHPKFALDYLCQKYFDAGKTDGEMIDYIVENIMGGTRKRSETSIKKEAMGHLHEAPFEMVAKYGAGDIILTKKLYDYQIKLIEKPHSSLLMFPSKYHNLEFALEREMKVLKALVEIERRGVPANMDHIVEKEKDLISLRDKLSQKCNDVLKWKTTYNPRSSNDNKRAFAELNLLDGLELTKTGNPSFSGKSLKGVNHPLADYLREIATLDKILSSYTSSMQELYNHKTGKIYCSFNQTKGEDGGAATGRFSCRAPNLQQVPKPKKDKGETSYMTSKLIRSAYYAPKGKLWGSVDWSQFENRVFAHYSGDEKLIKSYRDNPDIDYHTLVSELMDLATTLGLDAKSARGRAKTINLGLSFGMGKGMLADLMGLPWTMEEFTNAENKLIRWKKPGEEAEQLFKIYHETFPTVQPTLDHLQKLVMTRGFLLTLGGRRMNLEKRFSRKAGPYMFQGNAADIMKEKLIEVNDLTRNTECDLLLSVHDEYDVIAPEESINHWTGKIKDIMENVPQLNVPIRADVGIGENWFMASA